MVKSTVTNTTHCLAGLIMACVELRKSRESTDIAREAIRSLPTHPRIMTTAAQVLRGVGEMEKVCRGGHYIWNWYIIPTTVMLLVHDCNTRRRRCWKQRSEPIPDVLLP